MHYIQIDTQPKTFALILDTGDEIAGILNQFATRIILTPGLHLGATQTSSEDSLRGWFRPDARS
jgi:hypothetical protein